MTTENDHPDLDSLPDVLRQIALAIDLETALTLAMRLGGTEISLSNQPGPETLLAKAVGLDAARQIAELFGVGRLRIPLGPAANFSPRSVGKIRRLIAQGRGDQEIARAVRCHVDTVSRIRRGQTHRQSDIEDILEKLATSR